MEKEEQGKELVETFCEITSSSKEEALFFLESHNFDLDSAVSTFFSEDNNNPNPNTLSYHQSNNSPLPPPSLSSSSSPLPPHPSISSMSSPLHPEKKPSSSSSSAGRRPPPPPVGGIRTLSDLNRPSPDSDSDSDGPQEYYTGGQKSGMLVQDPTRGGNNVDAIFNQARQLGAVEGSTEKNLPPSSTSRSFTGTGRLLSGETLPLASNFQQPQQPERVTHDIVFYNNGFTVDDGPLRRLDDPENAPFLESIRKSECPKELEPADRRSSVHVNLIRREGNCPEREKQQVAFQGVGRTLGSSSSAVTSDAAVAGAAPLATSPAPPMSLVVDNNLASTSIQLRLADGTRMVARFNYHHRISDIRGFINASRPGGARSYQLQTVGFPPKQLTDDSQTIEEAGLANSVLIQKL